MQCVEKRNQLNYIASAANNITTSYLPEPRPCRPNGSTTITKWPVSEVKTQSVEVRFRELKWTEEEMRMICFWCSFCVYSPVISLDRQVNFISQSDKIFPLNKSPPFSLRGADQVHRGWKVLPEPRTTPEEGVDERGVCQIFPVPGRGGFWVQVLRGPALRCRQTDLRL